MTGPMAPTLVQAAIIAAFVLIHLFSGRLRFLDVIPRSRWLSMAGGVSVAYVFIHIFPELHEAQRSISAGMPLLPFVEHHAYLVALIGLSVFYGLERAVRSAQKRRGTQGEAATTDERRSTTTGMGIFWLHVSSFGLYNSLIGYLLVHREEQDLRGLLFFAGAMGVHFLVNDFGLLHDHQSTYRDIGRWVLAAAIVVGWTVGLLTTVGTAVTGVLFAFLAGGVVLNVLKEELPAERRSRFAPFLFGAVAYATLLLLL